MGYTEFIHPGIETLGAGSRDFLISSVRVDNDSYDNASRVTVFSRGKNSGSIVVDRKDYEILVARLFDINAKSDGTITIKQSCAHGDFAPMVECWKKSVESVIDANACITNSTKLTRTETKEITDVATDLLREVLLGMNKVLLELDIPGLLAFLSTAAGVKDE